MVISVIIIVIVVIIIVIIIELDPTESFLIYKPHIVIIIVGITIVIVMIGFGVLCVVINNVVIFRVLYWFICGGPNFGNSFVGRGGKRGGWFGGLGSLRVNDFFLGEWFCFFGWELSQSSF